MNRKEMPFKLTAVYALVSTGKDIGVKRETLTTLDSLRNWVKRGYMT